MIDRPRVLEVFAHPLAGLPAARELPGDGLLRRQIEPSRVSLAR